MNLTPKQEYELLAAISARGEIPTKFIYLDGGELNWDRVQKERSGAGAMGDAEIALLTTHLESFIKVYQGAPGINLVDLGCGNGLPAIPIIEEMRSQGFQVTYVSVDISNEMMAMAEQNLLDKFPDLTIKKLHMDFEKQSLTDALLDIKQENRYPNLLINLGNTLGNYVNTSSVLTNFLESMTLEDYLLLGNDLANDHNPQKILASYTDVVRDLDTRPAKLLGLYINGDEFKWVWNQPKSRVEARIRLKSHRTIALAGQKLELQKGEEIMVMQSNKYSESSLTRLLSEIGFRTELLTTTKNRDEILAMVQPTRYSVS